MFYLILLTFGTIFWYLYWERSYKQRYASLASIPGPTTYPIVGNILEFGFNSVEKLKNLQRLVNTYGPLYKAWLGPQKIYVVSTDPEFNEFILSSPKYIKKSGDYDIFRDWLGNGLLVSTASYWQKRRKIITPAFHFKILDDFMNVFNNESSKLVKRLNQNVGKKECDVYPYVTACTLDVICETAMGASVHAQDKTENEYVEAVKTMCNIIIERVFSAWKQFDSLFKYSNSYKKHTNALNIIHGFTKSVIEQRHNKIKNTISKTNDEDNEFGIKKKIAFLDILLQANIDGRPLSDEDIREEVDTFMFEGHDTTASAIAFAMYEIARNPEIQEKAFAELHEIFGNNKNCQPTVQDISNMKYLDLIVKESLRMYPSVPYIGRKLEEDVNYKGVVYPKGLTITIFIYGMQRRADLFPEPDKFIPERFLDKNAISNPFSYIPFRAGPRNCIGQKFAMNETKSTLAKILMNFELLPADSKYDIVLSGEVILKTANGIHVQLKERKY